MSLILAIAVFCIGTAAGATGVGGVLLIPVLMYFAGLSTHEAMATALFTFFFSGILATYAFQRRGSMHWRTTLPVCFGSPISSHFGAKYAATLPAAQLNLILAAVIVLSSLAALFPLGKSRLADTLGPGGSMLFLTGIGLFTGFLCGMTGAGGGIISLPIMLMSGYPALASIGTGQILQSIVSFSASLENYRNGFIVFTTAWPVVLCQLAGVVAGVRIAHALSVAQLKKAVPALCLATGIYIGLRALAL